MFYTLQVNTYNYEELVTNNKELVVYNENKVTNKVSDIININKFKDSIIFCLDNEKKEIIY